METKLTYQQLHSEFLRVLNKYAMAEEKRKLIAKIFADNTLDGVNSHGVNRFPVFIKTINLGEVNLNAEPELVSKTGNFENWEGHTGPGMYNATLCMDRAISLAKEHGISCVTVFNNNHWMRGATYGWQAADAGYIGICFTNALASMPPFGGKDSRLGNNPLVIAVPRTSGHVVLDMAISQYSYGKMYSYELEHQPLPYPGGYDEEGQLSTDPYVIKKSNKALPIGYWKGSGLALVLDLLLTALSGGKSTEVVSRQGNDIGVSQCFIAIHQEQYHERLLEEILRYTQSSTPLNPKQPVRYPGERTLKTRRKHLKDGIPVNTKIWERILAL